MVGESTRKQADKKKPILGIGGFFGYGNYGDELFLKVFEEYLGEDFSIRPLPDLASKPYFSRPVAEIVDEVDAVLIGGGDLILPWSIDPRYFHRDYLRKPVFILGVGVPIRAGNNNSAQVEKPEIVERYKKFFHSPQIKFFHARDQQSVDWIEKKTTPAISIIEAPDVVCALTFPKVAKSKGAPILGIATRHRPGKDAEDDYSQIEALGRRAIAEGIRVRHLILGTGEVGQRDFINAERVRIPGKEVLYSEDLDEISRGIGECTALASMKFHGSVAATMYGVPSVVLVPTSKNRNFMRRMGRDDLLCVFDSPDLPSKFQPFPDPIDPAWVKKLRTDTQNLFANLRTKLLEQVGQR